MNKELEQSIALVKRAKISNRNKELILSFKDKCIIEGLGPRRITKYLFETRKIAEWLGKDFDKADRKNIEGVISKLEQSDYAEYTKYGIKIAIRKFYKVIRNMDEGYPDEVRWIKPRVKNNHQKLPDDMLSQEDVIKLANATDHPRDRAFVYTLYDSGCRIGELLGLKIKHISKDEKPGILLTVSGKTGMRRIRVVSAEPPMAEWINKHPQKDNPEASVWITRDGKNADLCDRRVAYILERLKEKAGIKKKVNPHNFRHSRATFLAKHLTEAQLKQQLGWVQSSKMASIYVHLSQRDVDDALLKSYGINPDVKKESEVEAKPLNCPRCKTSNENTNKFCSLCGFVLDETEREKIVQNTIQEKEFLVKYVDKEMIEKMIEKRVKEMMKDK